MATVISTWGSEGTGLPSCRRSSPCSNRAPASSSPETNCEDADASMTTRPPRTVPVPRTSEREAVSVDLHAQRTQGDEHLADRAGPQVRVAVEA